VSSSGGRSALVIGIIGLCLAVPGTVVALNEMGGIDLFPKFFVDNGSSSDCASIAAPATLTLSKGQARRGEEITVHGRCFRPGERVEIKLHVETVGSATADSAGDFEQTVTVPESAPAPPFPTDVIAVGQSSIKSARAPFKTIEG